MLLPTIDPPIFRLFTHSTFFYPMENIFNLFKRNVFPSYLGVDIGTTSIKVAEVVGGKDRPRVVNYGILESSGYLARANQALQTSTLKLFDAEVVGLLHTVIHEMGTATTDVVASLPLFSVLPSAGMATNIGAT